MKVSARSILYLLLFTLWSGSLIAAFDTRQASVWWLFIVLAVVFTVLLIGTWQYWAYLQSHADRRGQAQRRVEEILADAHVPTLRWDECERCAGFWAGFLGTAAVTGGIVSSPATSIIPVGSGQYVAAIGFLAFVFGIAGHGLTNGVYKWSEFQILEPLASERAKFIAGVVAGAGIVVLGIGIDAATA